MSATRSFPRGPRLPRTSKAMLCARWSKDSSAAGRPGRKCSACWYSNSGCSAFSVKARQLPYRPSRSAAYDPRHPVTTIGICGQSLSKGHQSTFESLGHAFGVSFDWRAFDAESDVDGWIVFGAGPERVAAVRQSRKPCYVVLDGAAEHGSSSILEFSDRIELAPLLRRRR